MSAPVVTSLTFDKASYNKGDVITATVKYSDSNTHGVTAGSGTISPVGGTFTSFTTATPSINPQKVNDIIVMHVISQGSAPPTGVTGGNCTWKQAGTTFNGTVNAGFSSAVFVGTATATGAATATISFSGSPTAIRGITQEFLSSTGQYQVLTPQGNLDNTGSNSFPTLTPTAPNILYSGYAFSSSTTTAGSTPGYTYQTDANGNEYCYNPSCQQQAQTPTAGNATLTFGTAVLISAPQSTGSFTAVGGLIQSQQVTGNTTTISINPTSVGNLILLHVESEGSAPPASIQGGNCNWQQLGTNFQGTTNAGINEAVFAGTATATGAANATITYTGNPPSVNIRGHEFYSSTGQWTLVSQAGLDSAGTNTMPTLVPTAAGQLYAVSVLDSSTNVSGTTPGYTYLQDINSNGYAFNPSCTTDPQTPTFGDSTCDFGIAILLSTGTPPSQPNPTPTPAASPLILALTSHAGTDAFGNPFIKGLNVQKGAIAGTSITAGNTVTIDQTGMSVYNGAPTPANLELSVTPTGGITTKSPVIFNQFGGTPVANPSQGATVFSSHGDLQIVDGLDQSAYASQRRSLVTGADQTISGTTFATVQSSAVSAGASARTYRMHGKVFAAPNQTGGKVALRWTGPGSTVGHINFTYNSPTQVNNSAALDNGVSTAGAISMTMVNGNEQDITIDGSFQVPANTTGKFTIDAATDTAGDTWIYRRFSYIDVMPV